MSDTNEKLYLLQILNRGCLGNSPLFWQKGGCGYTQWIDDAKQWTRREALGQIRSTKGTHQWRVWPMDVVNAIARRTVDVQDIESPGPRTYIARLPRKTKAGAA